MYRKRGGDNSNNSNGNNENINSNNENNNSNNENNNSNNSNNNSNNSNSNNSNNSNVSVSPVIIYGVAESKYKIRLNEDWLNKKFPGLSIFSDDIMNGKMGAFLYGYELMLNTDTGKLDDYVNMMDEVKKLHSILVQHHNDIGSKYIPYLGYFTAVKGEGEKNYINYTPDAVTNYSASLQGLYMNALPTNATNAITFEPIEEGTNMVNFHGESESGRYYTRETYNSLTEPKRNPYTRSIIKPSNVISYKARVKGGKRRTLRDRRR